MAQPQTDIPAVQKEAKAEAGTADKTLSWYKADVGDKLSDQAKKLLEEYSGIPPEEVESHVYAVRDAAWAIWPYPCIGQFNFLDFSISHSPYYPLILSRLKSSQSPSLSSPPQTLLDLGCCFGQDIRVLTAAGVPSEIIYGSDIQSEFWDLGYKLFKDKEKLRSRFIPADIFSLGEDASCGLNELRGKMDIIHTASFLHLFPLSLQSLACEKIVSLLKPIHDPSAPSMVVGRQVGSLVPGEKQRLHTGKTMYRHNETSFKEMWRAVGEKTGTRWRVEVEVLERASRDARVWRGSGVEGQENENEGEGDVDEIRRLRFAVFREA